MAEAHQESVSVKGEAGGQMGTPGHVSQPELFPDKLKPPPKS